MSIGAIIFCDKYLFCGMKNQRIKAIRKELKLTQAEIAVAIGIQQPAYAQIETGRNKLTLDQLELLMDKFDVNPFFYIAGEEPIFLNKKLLAICLQNTGNSRQDEGDFVQVTSMHTYENANILIPIAAQAGYAHAWPDENLDEQISVVKIPGIQGKARTVEVKGDSMTPLLEPGDWVVARPVHDLFGVKEGKMYVVVSRSIGLTIKYLSLAEDGFTCSSANRLAYDPFTVPFEDVRELWEVNLRITEHIWSTRIAFDNPAQEERIRRLEAFLAKQFPNFE